MNLDLLVLLQAVQRLEQSHSPSPAHRPCHLLAPAQQLLVSFSVPGAPTPAARRLELLGIRLDPSHLRLHLAAGLLRQPLLRRLERRPPALLAPQMLRYLIPTI